MVAWSPLCVLHSEKVRLFSGKQGGEEGKRNFFDCCCLFVRMRCRLLLLFRDSFFPFSTFAVNLINGPTLKEAQLTRNFSHS